jgi:hypothetical protein
MMKKTMYSLLFFFLVGNSIAQQTPADDQTTAFSIEGATAHLGNGEVIENSLLMFSEGKITFVGSATIKTPKENMCILDLLLQILL